MRSLTTQVSLFFLSLIWVAMLVVRGNYHHQKFEKFADQSLETSNGYIFLTLNLAKEMEARFRLAGQEAPRALRSSRSNPLLENIILSDPEVKGKKVASVPDDPLNLLGILQNNEGEPLAVFAYSDYEIRVEAGEKILGRYVKKITGEKVYLNSQEMLFLYTQDGKKLAKRKTR